MTTIDTAPAWHVQSRNALVAAAALLSIGLGGCETASNLLSNSSTPEPAVAQAPPKPAQPVQQAKVAVAPVIGAPDALAKQLADKLGEGLERQRIGVAKVQGEQTDYTVRGYVVAAKEKAGTKVSYIWDVTDPSGKRVNRITGEELVPGGAQSKDPWASVTPQLVQTITDKTASSLGAWVPTQKGGAGGAAGTPVATNSTAPSAATVQTASTNAGAARPATAPAGVTGSVGRTGSTAATIASVTGAPGDGSSSLAAALQRELSKNGVAVSSQGDPSAHRIEGKVKVGEAKDGKQPIQIDWTVRDAAGKSKGTVSQKNEIPQGSLDGQWGQTADAAAAAAAQGIIKLLPKTN